MPVQEDRVRVADAAPAQLPVSDNNPCPFLRALVAGGYVDGHTVPLSTIGRTIEAASGERGLQKTLVGIKTFPVALAANGLGLARLWRSLRCGADLDRLRDGPLDKHGGGSGILDSRAAVLDSEFDRFEGFGSEQPNPDSGVERGLNAAQIKAFMKANMERHSGKARWYYPVLMQGEWPVLLRVMGKGDGDSRYLSVNEVRTLFKTLTFPERIVARLRAGLSR
jgi:hypothetical protein